MSAAASAAPDSAAPETTVAAAESAATSAYEARALDIPESLVSGPPDHEIPGLMALPEEYITVTPTLVDGCSTRLCSPDIFPLLVDDSKSSDTRPVKCHVSAARVLSGEKALDRILQLRLDMGDLAASLVPGGWFCCLRYILTIRHSLDSIGVVCPNPAFLVDLLMKRLGLEPDVLVKISTSSDTRMSILPPCLPPSLYV